MRRIFSFHQVCFEDCDSGQEKWLFRLVNGQPRLRPPFRSLDGRFVKSGFLGGVVFEVCRDSPLFKDFWTLEDLFFPRTFW